MDITQYNLEDKVREEKLLLARHNQNILIKKFRDKDIYIINPNQSSEVKEKAIVLLSTILNWNIFNEINELNINEKIKVEPKLNSANEFNLFLDFKKEEDKLLVVNFLELSILDVELKEKPLTKKIEIVNTNDNLMNLCNELNSTIEEKVDEVTKYLVKQITTESKKGL